MVYERPLDKKKQTIRGPMATVNDIVLIYLEDAPVSFARIENILPDTKKDWYHIKLLMLQVPLQVVTWILKEAYINGEEFFMNGKQMKLKKVECPVEDPSLSINKNLSGKSDKSGLSREETPESDKNQKPEDMPKNKKDQANIISFADLKNKDPQP